MPLPAGEPLEEFQSGPLNSQEESFTFSVQHGHFWGSGTGELIFSTRGIVYRSEDDEKHAREWDYQDIQEVKIASPTEMEILSYEDVRWKEAVNRHGDDCAFFAPFLLKHLQTSTKKTSSRFVSVCTAIA